MRPTFSSACRRPCCCACPLGGSTRVEGRFDPNELRLGQLDAFDRDNVEAQRFAVPLPMPHQQVTRCPDDAAALVRVDARERRDETVAATRPNLDDDERCAVAADEIQLAEPAAIALQQRLDAV